MEAAIIIPARYGSTRFPGKPLAEILGKSLLERTWQIAKAAKTANRVCIATDDERIFKYAIAFGADVQMTPIQCENGTERVLSALKLLKYKPDIVVNLQGDALLTPPHAIEELIKTLQIDDSCKIATLATRLDYVQYDKLLKQKANGDAGGTLVTFDRTGRALYFSKSMIPFLRNTSHYKTVENQLPVYRHIGIYGYRYDALAHYVSLQPTSLEQAEGLEQLRALENGIDIKVVVVDYHGRTHWSVDNPDDVRTAEEIILREGELV